MIAAVDRELSRREETYARLLEAIRQVPDRSVLAELRIAVKQQLPAAMQMRSALQNACRKADDRLPVAELEELESRERAAHLAKLSSVRGVDLANILFREYGIDLPTARKLVIDRNNAVIDLDRLLDSVFDIRRRRTPSGSRK